MAKIFLGGLYLGTINLRVYNYTTEQLESCGYKIEII